MQSLRVPPCQRRVIDGALRMKRKRYKRVEREWNRKTEKESKSHRKQEEKKWKLRNKVKTTRIEELSEFLVECSEEIRVQVVLVAGILWNGYIPSFINFYVRSVCLRLVRIAFLKLSTVSSTKVYYLSPETTMQASGTRSSSLYYYKRGRVVPFRATIVVLAGVQKRRNERIRAKLMCEREKEQNSENKRGEGSEQEKGKSVDDRVEEETFQWRATSLLKRDSLSLCTKRCLHFVL